MYIYENIYISIYLSSGKQHLSCLQEMISYLNGYISLYQLYPAHFSFLSLRINKFSTYVYAKHIC